MTDRLRPETVAVTLAQHAHDTEPEPQTYLARVVAELFEAEPGVLEHVSDLFFADLSDELSRRGKAEAVRAVLEIQNHWAKGGLDQ
jgi:hypothetical protein